MSAVFTHTNCCCSADTGHSGMVEKQDEKDVKLGSGSLTAEESQLTMLVTHSFLFDINGIGGVAAVLPRSMHGGVKVHL